MGRVRTIGRIALGLVSLTVLLVLILDFAFGLLPDEVQNARKVRERIAAGLAVQLTALVEAEDQRTIQRTVDTAVTKGGEILSVGVRRQNGELVVKSGYHDKDWVPTAEGKSTLTHVVVPVYSGKERWGQVEMSFKPVGPQSWIEWLHHPTVLLIVALTVGGFIFYYFYLRKVLQHLDPTAVIPDRVRMAFDTLAEGVLVIDTKGRINMANSAFRRLHPQASSGLLGQNVASLDWLKTSLPQDPAAQPWNQAMASREPVIGTVIDIPQGGGRARKAVLNCSPIVDNVGRARGCLATFDDVTDLEEKNAELQRALDELESSRAKIEEQNKELAVMAARDSLTGMLNRRAFFAEMEKIYMSAITEDLELCMIMADIDHFKSINDRFGHAVGDEAIKQMARIISSSVRGHDLVCRYGGEEFVIALPNTTVEKATEIAKRMRRRIEAEGGPGIRNVEGLQMTSSFGVSTIRFGGTSVAELVDQADQALYAAKKSGRNRALRWDELEPGHRHAAAAG
ncbi:MAG: diguanylate cyclase [Burkholderiales bacterium]|nr:diguanylate cyclase [Burkholderiales bacterium]